MISDFPTDLNNEITNPIPTRQEELQRYDDTMDKESVEIRKIGSHLRSGYAPSINTTDLMEMSKFWGALVGEGEDNLIAFADTTNGIGKKFIDLAIDVTVPAGKKYGYFCSPSSATTVYVVDVTGNVLQSIVSSYDAFGSTTKSFASYKAVFSKFGIKQIAFDQINNNLSTIVDGIVMPVNASVLDYLGNLLAIQVPPSSKIADHNTADGLTSALLGTPFSRYNEGLANTIIPTQMIMIPPGGSLANPVYIPPFSDILVVSNNVNNVLMYNTPVGGTEKLIFSGQTTANTGTSTRFNCGPYTVTRITGSLNDMTIYVDTPDPRESYVYYAGSPSSVAIQIRLRLSCIINGFYKSEFLSDIPMYFCSHGVDYNVMRDLLKKSGLAMSSTPRFRGKAGMFMDTLSSLWGLVKKPLSNALGSLSTYINPTEDEVERVQRKPKRITRRGKAQISKVTILPDSCNYDTITSMYKCGKAMMSPEYCAISYFSQDDIEIPTTKPFVFLPIYNPPVLLTNLSSDLFKTTLIPKKSTKDQVFPCVASNMTKNGFAYCYTFEEVRMEHDMSVLSHDFDKLATNKRGQAMITLNRNQQQVNEPSKVLRAKVSDRGGAKLLSYFGISLSSCDSDPSHASRSCRAGSALPPIALPCYQFFPVVLNNVADPWVVVLSFKGHPDHSYHHIINFNDRNNEERKVHVDKKLIIKNDTSYSAVISRALQEYGNQFKFMSDLYYTVEAMEGEAESFVQSSANLAFHAVTSGLPSGQYLTGVISKEELIPMDHEIIAIKEKSASTSFPLIVGSGLTNTTGFFTHGERPQRNVYECGTLSEVHHLISLYPPSKGYLPPYSRFGADIGFIPTFLQSLKNTAIPYLLANDSTLKKNTMENLVTALDGKSATLPSTSFKNLLDEVVKRSNAYFYNDVVVRGAKSYLIDSLLTSIPELALYRIELPGININGDFDVHGFYPIQNINNLITLTKKDDDLVYDCGESPIDETVIVDKLPEIKDVVEYLKKNMLENIIIKDMRDSAHMNLQQTKKSGNLIKRYTNTNTKNTSNVRSKSSRVNRVSSQVQFGTKSSEIIRDNPDRIRNNKSENSKELHKSHEPKMFKDNAYIAFLKGEDLLNKFDTRVSREVSTTIDADSGAVENEGLREEEGLAEGWMKVRMTALLAKALKDYGVSKNEVFGSKYWMKVSEKKDNMDLLASKLIVRRVTSFADKVLYDYIIDNPMVRDVFTRAVSGGKNTNTVNILNDPEYANFKSKYDSKIKDAKIKLLFSSKNKEGRAEAVFELICCLEDVIPFMSFNNPFRLLAKDDLDSQKIQNMSKREENVANKPVEEDVKDDLFNPNDQNDQSGDDNFLDDQGEEPLEDEISLD